MIIWYLVDYNVFFIYLLFVRTVTYNVYRVSYERVNVFVLLIIRINCK